MRHFSHLDLALAGFGPVLPRPALFASQVITGGQSPVVDRIQIPQQGFHQLGGIGSSTHRIDGSAVSRDNRVDILGSATPAFDFQYLDTGLQKLIEKLDGRNIVGRHDKVIVNSQLLSGFLIHHVVFPATILDTGAAVGRSIVRVEGHPAAPGNCDTQSAVGKSFDLRQPAGRSPHILPHYSLVEFANHAQTQLAG